jgi:hypothetical protein
MQGYTSSTGQDLPIRAERSGGRPKAGQDAQADQTHHLERTVTGSLQLGVLSMA